MLSKFSLVALAFLLLCPLSLCAAESDLPDPKSYESMGWIVAAIFGIVGLANQGIALWDRLFPRASPPANEVYATKLEIKELERERTSAPPCAMKATRRARPHERCQPARRC